MHTCVTGVVVQQKSVSSVKKIKFHVKLMNVSEYVCVSMCISV